MVRRASASVAKLAMADTQEWRHLIYFIVGILILYGKNVAILGLQ